MKGKRKEWRAEFVGGKTGHKKNPIILKMDSTEFASQKQFFLRFLLSLI